MDQADRQRWLEEAKRRVFVKKMTALRQGDPDPPIVSQIDLDDQWDVRDQEAPADAVPEEEREQTAGGEMEDGGAEREERCTKESCRKKITTMTKHIKDLEKESERLRIRCRQLEKAIQKKRGSDEGAGPSSRPPPKKFRRSSFEPSSIRPSTSSSSQSVPPSTSRSTHSAPPSTSSSPREVPPSTPLSSQSVPPSIPSSTGEVCPSTPSSAKEVAPSPTPLTKEVLTSTPSPSSSQAVPPTAPSPTQEVPPSPSTPTSHPQCSTPLQDTAPQLFSPDDTMKSLALDESPPSSPSRQSSPSLLSQEGSLD